MTLGRRITEKTGWSRPPGVTQINNMLNSGTTSKPDEMKSFKYPGLEMQKRRWNRKRKRSLRPRSLSNGGKIRKEGKTKINIH